MIKDNDDKKNDEFVDRIKNDREKIRQDMEDLKEREQQEQTVERKQEKTIGREDFEQKLSNNQAEKQSKPKVNGSKKNVPNNDNIVDPVDDLSDKNNTDVVNEAVTNITKSGKYDEDKPKKQEQSKQKPTKPKDDKNEVNIVSPEEARSIEAENDTSNKKVEIAHDDIDGKIIDIVQDIHRENMEVYREDIQTNVLEGMTQDQLFQEISDIYDIDSPSDSKIAVDVINDISKDEPSKPKQKKKPITKPKSKKPVYGGDGEVTSFKMRTAKTAKIIRNIDVADTENIKAQDIDTLSNEERKDVFMKTVLSTLQPSYTVVPFIVSGVVITMSAFSWMDVKEIKEIEEKVYDLSPHDEDYIYRKNLVFIEKRRKQLELFYKRIYSVSGYKDKPSFDELFGKILKLPDFSQLFFGEYAATFRKSYTYDIYCGTCGYKQSRTVEPKDLCFLLNKNIDLDKLLYYIDKGSAIGSPDTIDVYKKFQDENIVKTANTEYRISEELPISSFIFEIKVPTILEALDTLEVLAEQTDDEFEIIVPETGDSFRIDSPSAFNNMNMRRTQLYLYISGVLVPKIIRTDQENSSATVSYVRFKEKHDVLRTVFQLSPQDYDALMTDQKLLSLQNVQGIRHAINGGTCEAEICKSDMGIIPAEPELLFFTIAQQS